MSVRAASIAALLVLAGCVSILPEPPPAPFVYPLRAAPQAPPQGAPAPLVLANGRPNTVQALAVLDVVWVRDGRVAYLERETWTARAPEALQTLLAETISAQDLVRAAIRVGEGPRADYEVRWDLFAFQIEESPDRIEARIEAAVRLVRSGGREVVAARAVSLSAPIAMRDASAAVSVLQSVAAQAASEIGVWAASEAVRDAAARNP